MWMKNLYYLKSVIIQGFLENTSREARAACGKICITPQLRHAV